MKDITIQVNSKNNEVYRDNNILGISSENLQGKIIFKPVPFVNGTCRLYIEDRGSILMEKQEDCYTLDILSSLLTEPSLDLCFKITEPENEKGTPIFCSKIIHFKVYDTIETEGEIPEDYPSWEQILDSKIAELEALEEDVEEAEEERNQAVQEAIDNIQDMTEAYNQNAVAKTNAFNTNATNKTNAFDNHVSNKEAEFDTDTNAIVSTKKAELDEYEESKENELDTHTNSLKNDLDAYESAKETELNSYTVEKKTELDTYEGTKETELDTYANGLKSDFDTNATNKTNDFNTNATNKTTEFDYNATAKTTAFNENAEEKTGDFNDNVDTKTTEFDAHVEEKEAEFDENVDSIQEQITDIQEFIDSELEQETTEKGTRVDIMDSAKWYGELAPEGRTEQKQLSGKNLFDINSEFEPQSATYKFNFHQKPNTQYTVSTNCPQSNTANLYVNSTSSSSKAYINLPKTITSDENGDFYILVRIAPVQDDPNTFNLYRAVINGEYWIQVEEGSTATDYEEYCGGQPSPNPDYPQDIENVEGRSTTNLVKVTTDNSLKSDASGYANYSVNDATHEVISTGKTLMGFKVKVEPSTQYSIQCLLKDTDNTIIKNMRVREYSAEPITSTDWSGESYIIQSVNESFNDGYKNKTFTTQENTQWILFAFYSNGGNTTVTEWQVNKGSILLPYEEYFEGKRLEFNVCNKNLFDNEWEIGIINGNTGVNQDNNNYIRGKNFIPVKELTNYKISDAENIFNRMNVYEYKSDFSYNLSANKTIYTYLTTEKDTAYIRIRPAVSTTDTSVKVQIEEGTTASPYEEHKEQTIILPLNNIELCKIGDYQDSIRKENGKWYLHKEIGKVVLDGGTGSSWAKGSLSNEEYSVFQANGYLLRKFRGTSLYLYCDKLIPKNNVNVSVLDYESIFTGNAPASPIRIALRNSRLTSLDNAGVNAFLQQNPLTVYGVLQTPEDTEITDVTMIEQLEALEHLMLYKGVNHIWTETDGVEPNLQLTYYKSNKERLNNIEARLELLEE